MVTYLCLPVMCYNKNERIKIYANAVDGLISLEPRYEYRLKYIDFIDQYADLNATELAKYKSEYVSKSNAKEDVMGLLQHTRDEGMLQGMQKGEATILLRQMKKKFGEVPKNAEARIEQADSDQLLEWSENVLTATTVDEVFH